MLVRDEMDWGRFDAHGEDKRAAFEAFSGQLFERWCRKEHGHALREVRFVRGEGGDGGVEAYALLASGDCIGLQAKWFEGGLGEAQIRQIERSLRTAIKNRPRLIRYCIALRQNLTDERGRREETERRRWDAFLVEASSIAPGTVVERWDEARLRSLLTEPGNEGLHAYWFSGSVVLQQDLERRFKAQQNGWLRARYVPDLHAAGRLEADLSIRLSSLEARSPHFRRAQTVAAELRAVRRDVIRLAAYPTFMRSAEASELREQALRALARLIRAAEADAEALRVGAEAAADASVQGDDVQDVQRLEVALAQLDRNNRRSHAPTHKIYERVKRSLHGEKAALLDLQTRKHWWERLSRITAYLGPPGAGKTHGLAHAVHARLEEGLPALLLRAKDCPTSAGWEGILRKALDRPGTPLVELLNALEAAAVRADVRRAQPEPASSTELALEPTRVLLAIDGLEESGLHHLWAELLGELPVQLASHPRIRVAVTLRTASGEAILGSVRGRSGVVDEVKLPEGGEVQRLLPEYCRYYKIELPDRRLRWAIRDPLSVKLYCELRVEHRERPAYRQDISIPALLQAKLDHIEKDLRPSGGWSKRDAPIHVLLEIIAVEHIRRGSALPRDEVIELASGKMPRIPHEKWSWILDQCEERGLLLMHADEPDGPLGRRIQVVEPAFDPLTDFLIARQACEHIGAADVPDTVRGLPAQLRLRPDALSQAAVLLAQKGISLIRSGLWTHDLPPEVIERLELRAIAALNTDAAGVYGDWVLDRLRSSMPSCRRVLKELCIPVARDDEHPFGPRFVHEALLPLQPAKRDLFWSGPRYLHGEADQPWAGEGDEALELLELEPDDAADGPPLLLAWALTSVDSRWRREVRAKLARWGSRQIDELLRWLDLAFQTNDPQMAEDAATVAFGAACLAGRDMRVAGLARWADENLLAPDAPHRREDVAVLHAARGIVERARVMGVPVDAPAVERARRLYRTDGRTLPFDTEAARTASDHDGVRPITGDLAWYVVPASIEGFFEPVRHHERESADPALRLATNEFLSAAMAGTLGPLSEEVRRAFEEEIERRQTQKHSLNFLLGLATNEHPPGSGSEETIAEDVKPSTGTCDREQDSLPYEHLGASVESDAAGRWDSRTEAILAQHAKLAQVEELTPQRFAFGVLKAHLREVGWSEDEPPEQESGHRASMDGAIMWAHRPATHGGRSPICTTAEKYVWTGCRLLGVYLGARAPFLCDPWDGIWIEPPVDPVLITSMEPNPASDVPEEREHGAAAAWSFWPDDALIVKSASLARTQAARAVEWMRTAPLPEIRPWLLLPRYASPPHIADMEDEDWITLRGLVSAREEDAQADSQLQIWAAGVAGSDADLLARDTKLGLRTLQDALVELAEQAVRRAGYVDPSEALWAPWLTRMAVGRSVVTLDEQGALKVVELMTATAEADWASSTGGKEIWAPAHWIQRAIGLTDARPAHGGAEWHFADRNGIIHALYTSRRLDGEVRRALIIRRRSLEAATNSCGLALLWLGQLRREPGAELRSSLSEEERDLHGVWSWLARMLDTGPVVIHGPGSGEFSGNDPEPQIPRATQEPAAAAPLVQVGPVNPDLAVPLSTELTDDAIPYFLWDDPMPVSELRRRLATAPPHERTQLLGKILREARDPDVWHFTTPAEVAARFSMLARHLGRRRRFWEFLLNRWHTEGLLEQKPA
ncbi:hypothetical protein BE21_24290 [Sorangium cellulosum]|uniref:ATP-binding protein n=1 Tax=Sorangium cellulosum TaxID=56 RepID=A0A150TUG6_SORCE|nr:hypothetical protein BE21_24290 [Sorangium cellulosum]